MKIDCIQRLIDRIRRKPNFPECLTCKVEGYKLQDNVETLILGSSHVANGYTPIEGEYNFAMPSQDLYYTYNVYKKVNRPTIKNLVVSFSVFTPGLSIVRTKCSDFCVPYKLLLDIDYQNASFAEENGLFKMESGVAEEIEYCRKHSRMPKNYLGGILRYPRTKFDKKASERQALGHYKNHQREDSQMSYCEALIKDAKANNQKVFFVITPTTDVYRNVLPPKEDIFKILYDMVSQYDNTKVLDYFDSKSFDEKVDFTNEDHLNKHGADKLSNFVREEIKLANKIAE